MKMTIENKKPNKADQSEIEPERKKLRRESRKSE
jgi:hypothetical protein